MPYTFYRGDSRFPDELQDGFRARVQLSLTQARALIERYSTSTVPISLPVQKLELELALNRSGAPQKLSGLSQIFKVEKNSSTMQISTDITEDCGGYVYGNIYEIVCEQDFNTLDASMRLSLAPPSLKVMVNPLIVIDSMTIATARTVAVAIRGGEVAFLTPIPRADIKRYKTSDRSPWMDMPRV